MPAPSDRRSAVAAWACGALALLAGCAGPRLDAQWSDPQLKPGLLRGAKVLVACEAYEPVVKQLCGEQMKSELVARGATPVEAPSAANSTPGRPVADDQLLAAARAAGASAVWSTSMAIGESTAPGGSGVSVGLGGGGGHVGGGIGISLPIPGLGSSSSNGYAANARLIDASGKLVWTGKASTPPSGDVNGQVGELARTLMGAADKAGVF